MSSRDISNTDDVIDSRDVIARIEELESVGEDEILDDDDMEELRVLKALAEEAESSPDWIHGEGLIRESYFVDYTEQLIDDCFELPKELNSGDWPYRYITIDYEAAADELKQDYFEVDFDGVTYLIRA